MYDLIVEFDEFYNKHVRLGLERRKDLGKKRDLNLDRVRAGLDALAEETGRARPHFEKSLDQGSYAMHTLNQDPGDANDYDIDVGLIFGKDDLPAGALEARQRVRDALLKKCTNFSKEPEARTNAVTISYSDGYHVDFAVYRTYTDAYGRTVTEHASTDWTARDPSGLNDWFAKANADLSPSDSNYAGGYRMVKVAPGQFRRVTRWAKWFCKSRDSWSLPGGMVVSTLLAESGTFKANRDRDDRALYDTLKALHARLLGNCEVPNPLGGSNLTSRGEVLNQVTRLRDRLGENLAKLDVLFQAGCTRTQARDAWDWIFNHDYWREAQVVESAMAKDRSTALALPYLVSITCGLANKEGGRIYRNYQSGQYVLPKGVSLNFTVAQTNVPPPYSVRWTCNNVGDEAQEGEQVSWVKDEPAIWTSTLYKGTHRMTCQVMRDGRVLAEAVHVVKIGTGGGRLFSR